MNLNTYRVEFFSICPSNGIRIKYFLEIKTDDVIQVEQIIDEVTLLSSGYHEAHADQLQRVFGGSQKLVANHHGVEIETTREEKKWKENGNG